jgi:hypothetical protein
MIRTDHTYYRCLARTLAPGSAALTDHPKTVNLREGAVLEPLNSWIGQLFSRENIDQTITPLIASQQETPATSTGRGAMTKRLAEAQARLRRYQAATPQDRSSGIGGSHQRGTSTTRRRTSRTGRHTTAEQPDRHPMPRSLS